MGKWNNRINKPKRSGTIKPTKIDWARLAAYIDGEGCISTSTAYSEARKWKSESIYVTLSVHNTDPRLVDWILERWGGRIWKTTQNNPKWATSFGWKVSCQQAREILEGCLTFFIIKREQAEIAISLMKTTRRWGPHGMPSYVRELRWELRRQLSESKGQNARIKQKEPRIIDHESKQSYSGKVQ
jgi:hypothetical protein